MPIYRQLGVERQLRCDNAADVIFPTRFKKRISNELSYPLTAKDISVALADVPQANVMQIEFWYYQRMKDRGKPYTVLSVSYGFTPQITTGSYIELCDWCIMVRPVPRRLRHNVNRLLKTKALPAIRIWLLE